MKIHMPFLYAFLLYPFALAMCVQLPPAVLNEPIVSVTELTTLSVARNLLKFEIKLIIQNNTNSALDFEKVDYAVDLYGKELFRDTFSGLKRTSSHGIQTVTFPFQIATSDIRIAEPDQRYLRITFRGSVYPAAYSGLAAIAFSRSFDTPIPDEVTKELERRKEIAPVSPIRPASSSQKPSVITILDFRIENISKADANLILDLLFNSLVKQQKFTVIDRAKRDEVLEEIEFSQSDCADEKCQLQVGKLLSADLIIVGSIGQVSNRFLLNTKLLKVETSEALATSSRIYRSLDELVDTCQEVITELSRNL